VKEIRASRGSWRHVVGGIGPAVAALAVLTAGPAAQQAAHPGSGRLNQIIARHLQGLPAFGNEHFQLFGLEHNPFLLMSMQQGWEALKPAGAARPIRTPIVRIHYDADLDYRSEVKQWLDAGAFGIVLPLVNNAVQAERFVRAMRYPHQRVMDGKRPREPLGERGYSASRAAAYWGIPEVEYVAKADVWPLVPDGELLAMVMIERMEAVKNLKEILAVPGVGAIMIGQADLTMSMGLGTPAAGDAQQNSPQVQAVVADILRTCAEYQRTQKGKGLGAPICGTFNNTDQPTRIKQGVTLFTGPRGAGYRD
jgi:4-hydroxy-2-oxoheptanedioate aldolase